MAGDNAKPKGRPATLKYRKEREGKRRRWTRLVITFLCFHLLGFFGYSFDIATDCLSQMVTSSYCRLIMCCCVPVVRVTSTVRALLIPFVDRTVIVLSRMWAWVLIPILTPCNGSRWWGGEGRGWGGGIFNIIPTWTTVI